MRQKMMMDPLNGPIITTSWDDGHPLDMKLADLLAKYGVAGTFYVPCNNIEGRQVLDVQALRELSSSFEIGAHTVDHVDLTTLCPAQATRQIAVGRAIIEERVGKFVHGFCYPRGKYSANIRKLTEQAGFSYARTTKNLCTYEGDDAFQLPTTLQFYPHTLPVYIRNFVSFGPDIARLKVLQTSIASPNINKRVESALELCLSRNGYFHLWGHSWEIAAGGLWEQLEETLRQLEYVRRHRTNVSVVTNLGIWQRRWGRTESGVAAT